MIQPFEIPCLSMDEKRLLVILINSKLKILKILNILNIVMNLLLLAYLIWDVTTDIFFGSASYQYISLGLITLIFSVIGYFLCLHYTKAHYVIAINFQIWIAIILWFQEFGLGIVIPIPIILICIINMKYVILYEALAKQERFPHFSENFEISKPIPRDVASIHTDSEYLSSDE